MTNQNFYVDTKADYDRAFERIEELVFLKSKKTPAETRELKALAKEIRRYDIEVLGLKDWYN